MPNTPVLEREAELAALSRARRRAGTGRGGWITVTGPAGIGKTRLLEWVAAEAAVAGWFVLEARSTGAGPDRSILLEMLRGPDLGAAPFVGPARALTALLGGETPPARELALGLHLLLDELGADHPRAGRGRRPARGRRRRSSVRSRPAPDGCWSGSAPSPPAGPPRRCRH